eukprot:JZ554038.1.p2 GENE.JZ554038.1~~JZ554038.1.p2  ORF type:complete len:108 (+),score=18.52 JZ554038.1:30-326(+)
MSDPNVVDTTMDEEDGPLKWYVVLAAMLSGLVVVPWMYLLQKWYGVKFFMDDDDEPAAPADAPAAPLPPAAKMGTETLPAPSSSTAPEEEEHGGKKDK